MILVSAQLDSGGRMNKKENAGFRYNCFRNFWRLKLPALKIGTLQKKAPSTQEEVPLGFRAKKVKVTFYETDWI